MNPDDNDIVYTQYAPDFLGFFERIVNAIAGSDGTFDAFVAWISAAWVVYSVLAFIASFIFIIGIVYSYIRMNQLSEIEAQIYDDEAKKWQEIHGNKQENRQWSEIQKHLQSDNPSDWKLSIIEADIILGDILNTAGYAGHSIGEQLKSASSSNFATLQDAWDAHKIRNRIAHEGSDFILTQSMAKEAIVKYQRVFREFDIV